MSEKICYICLKIQNVVINVGTIDESNQKILLKLQICVPEVKWELSYFICSVCLTQLNIVNTFRALCIESDKKRKSQNNLLVSDLKLTLPSTEDENLKNEPETNVEDSDDCNDTQYDFNIASVEPEITDKQSIAKIKPFQCDQCNKLFKFKKVLDNHIKNVHYMNKIVKRKREYSCISCEKIFTTKILLNKHCKNCKANSIYEGIDSKNCDADYKTEKEERKCNIKEKTQISNVCDICGSTFSNKYLVKRHKRNVHATEKKYKCEICPQTFVSAVYLNAHKRYHSRERTHICSFCGKGYITASDLYHHEKIHANKRAYRCETCDKAFNTSSDLYKHKICVHMDRSLWKYVCTFCDRRFPLKTNLDTHIKTHTGEKQFSCHLCDRKCINKSVLMRHIDTHSNVRAFKCTVCLQGYKYKKSLNIHLVKVHGIGDIKLPVKVKKFFCHICPKSYFANNKLQKHIRSHTGDRPFKCSQCEKSFIDKSYVKQHLKTTHNFIDNIIYSWD